MICLMVKVRSVIPDRDKLITLEKMILERHEKAHQYKSGTILQIRITTFTISYQDLVIQIETVRPK